MGAVSLQEDENERREADLSGNEQRPATEPSLVGLDGQSRLLRARSKPSLTAPNILSTRERREKAISNRSQKARAPVLGRPVSFRDGEPTALIERMREEIALLRQLVKRQAKEIEGLRGTPSLKRKKRRPKSAKGKPSLNMAGGRQN